MSTDRTNLRGVEITFDFWRKALVYKVYLKQSRKIEAIRQRAAQMGLQEPNSQITLDFKRSATGRILITFSGPAIAHIYQALPILGAPMTGAEADELRRALDKLNRTQTKFFVRDATKLVDRLCA